LIAAGLSSLRYLCLNILAAFRARERRTSADRLRMIRRRLLLVERSLHGGAAELQETELPSLALLPFVAATSTAAAAQDEHGGRASGSTGIPRSYSAAAAAAASGREDWDTSVSSTAQTQRRPPRAPSTSNLFPLPSAAAGAGGGGGIGEDSAGVAAARVAERIWEVVDEGNRVVLIGRLFELSDHPDCFRGVTDAKLVRTTDCTALALCLPVGLMCRCVPCVWCGNCSPRILPRLSSLTHLTGARNGG
jgi:hypothetical protein